MRPRGGMLKFQTFGIGFKNFWWEAVLSILFLAYRGLNARKP